MCAHFERQPRRRVIPKSLWGKPQTHDPPGPQGPSLTCHTLYSSPPISFHLAKNAPFPNSMPPPLRACPACAATTRDSTPSHIRLLFSPFPTQTRPQLPQPPRATCRRAQLATTHFTDKCIVFISCSRQCAPPCLIQSLLHPRSLLRDMASSPCRAEPRRWGTTRPRPPAATLILGPPGPRPGPRPGLHSSTPILDPQCTQAAVMFGLGPGGAGLCRPHQMELTLFARRFPSYLASAPTRPQPPGAGARPMVSPAPPVALPIPIAHTGVVFTNENSYPYSSVGSANCRCVRKPARTLHKRRPDKLRGLVRPRA